MVSTTTRLDMPTKPMLLSPADLEIPRTATDLRAFVESVRATVHANRTEFESSMAKRGYYKELLDEVEPLCNFAEAAYPPDHRVQPVLGNQGYDALVFDSQGNEVDKVEFAKPYDGAAAASNARQVSARGYSDMQICDHTDVLKDLVPFFEDTIKAKSLKDYGGVTLVFTLAAPPALRGVEASFEWQVAHIKSIIVAKKFKAKRVLLYVPPGRLLPMDG